MERPSSLCKNHYHKKQSIMNKTIDINIANQIFHLDENAYLSLKNYLDAIKAYLANEQSQEEIIQDIEARIAELFIERMISDKQVINTEDVNEIIKIMGQPEDYDLSDENEKTAKASQNINKKLFRDKENSYISGVSAGLGHYMGIDVVWVRLLWILLSIFTTGWFIVIYILLWILIPEARTTAEKLAMKGEPINLSNIEKKIKEGYDNVSEKFKDVDVQKQSKKAQSSISSFFSQLEVILVSLGKVLIKIIGSFLLLISGLGLLGILFSALGISGIGLFSSVDFDTYVRMDGFLNSIFPTWLILISMFISAVVPLLFIFIFSLKMLFSNIKRPSLAFIITLVSIWLLGTATLVFAGVNSETRQKVKGETVNTEQMRLDTQDTLYIKMKGNLNYTNSPFRHNETKVTYDNDNNKIIYDSDVDVRFHETNNDEALIRISKWTWDFEEDKARNLSQFIDYQYELNENELLLNTYLIAPIELKNNSRGVDIDIYVPENTLLSLHKNVEYFLKNRFKNYKIEEPFNQIYNIEDHKLHCIDCEEIPKNKQELKTSGNQTEETNVLNNNAS